MMRTPAIILAIMAVLALAGCGGQAPQMNSFGTGDSSFGFGSSGNSFSMKSGPNRQASSFWSIDSLKRSVQSEEISSASDKVGDTELVVKEISYEGERWEGNPTKVFGYYAYPTRNKGTRYPGIIQVHGSGQNASKEFVKDWAARGYAALSIDLPGRGPSRDDSRSTGPDMSDENILKCKESPKESWLFPATSAVVRGVTFLANQPNVDTFRIGVVGYGWGGVMALITNGIDNRVKAACSVYGAGHIGDRSAWADKLKKLNSKSRQAWIEAYDPASYVKSQSGPVLFLSATGSTDYPLDCLLKTAKETQADHRCVLSANSGKLDDLTSGDIGHWFDWALKSGSEFPKVATQVKGSTLSVTAKGGPAVVKAVLYHKSDASGKWESTEAKPTKGACTFTLPSDGQSVSYFVSLIDDRGCVVSSDVATYRAKNVKTASSRR